MNLLALDTSSEACIVAAISGTREASRSHHVAKAHTRVLLPMIDEVLQEVGLVPADVDTLVVGNGPGSFIGLRIAASVAQGLAYASGAKVFPVSSMAVIAAEAGSAGDVVVVTQDARMGQVYLGAYRLEADGLPTPVIGERLQAATAIPELAEIAGEHSLRAAGSGWHTLPAILEENRDWISDVDIDHKVPGCRGLLKLALAAADSGKPVAVEDLQPVYLRDEVAQKPM